jgi:hypothetical protein
MEYIENDILQNRYVIHPHCLVYGKKAFTEYGKFIFVCKKHHEQWAKDFFSWYRDNKRIKGNAVKCEWRKRFLKFLIKETKG